MKEIKQGTKLKSKNGVGSLRVAFIGGDLYFLVDPTTDSYYGAHTRKNLDKFFTIVDEPDEWKHDEEYWFVNSCGEVICDYWDGSDPDIFRRDYLGIYRTQSEAEEARKKMKKITEHHD